MKIKALLLLIITIFLYSCNQEKIAELENENLFLKKENRKLRDSISNQKINEIYSLKLIGYQERYNSKVGEETKIHFDFALMDKIKNYNVYSLSDDNKRKLILENQQSSHFIYKHTPKHKNDNQVKLEAIFHLDSLSLKIPALLSIDLEN